MDHFSIFFHVLVVAITAVVILSSYEYMEVQQIRAGEYYALILLGAVGMSLMSSAVELVLIFIALEISSISTYVLAGFRRRAAISSESSLKYFLLGSFATAFFLYGVALMFGATGSTSIPVIGDVLTSGNIPTLAYVAMALMFRGPGIQSRRSAVSHMDSGRLRRSAFANRGIDVNGAQGGGFCGFAADRFCGSCAGPLMAHLGGGGALDDFGKHRRAGAGQCEAAAGLFFDRSRRISVGGLRGTAGHDGIPCRHVLYRFLCGDEPWGIRGGESFRKRRRALRNLEDYEGLGRSSPLLAATLTIFLLSLIGIPMTGGFFAKFYVFSAALQANLVGLTIIGVLNSAVGAYYYLRIIVVMYMKEPKEDTPLPRIPMGLGAALVVSLAATIYLGVLPGRVLEYASRSVSDLLH